MPLLADPPALLQRVRGLATLQSLPKLFRRNADRGRERYRKAGLSASVTFIQKVLTIGISLLSVPLTVHYLGAERYGVWLTISSLIVWMALTDFGLAGNALVNVLSESNGRDDRKAALEYTASAVWALTAVAAALGLAALAGFRFVPWNRVFHVSASSVDPRELALAVAFTFAFFLLGLPLSVQASVYSAHQDGFLASGWGIGINLASLAALVLVTRFHGGLPQLVLALAGTRIAVLAVNFYFMFWRRYPWLRPRPSAFRRHAVRRLAGLGGKYLVTQLGALGIYQSQPLIITQVLGPKDVVVFVIAQKIITLPMDLVYMATSPFVPAFGEARARDDWAWIRKAFRNATVGSVAAALPLLVAIGLAAKPLIRIWAGAAAVTSTSLILWLSAYNLSGVALMAAGQLMIGVERVTALAVSLALCAAGTIGFGILFAHYLGLSGVALAMIFSKLITLWPIQLWAVRRILRRPAPPAFPATGRANAAEETVVSGNSVG